MSEFIEFLKEIRALQEVLEGAPKIDKGAQSEATAPLGIEKIADSVRHMSPYINESGDLVIPIESDPRYHWWRGGQSVFETLMELKATEDILDRYVHGWRAKFSNENLN